MSKAGKRVSSRSPAAPVTRYIPRLLVYLAVITVCVGSMAPLLYVVSTSMKDSLALFTYPPKLIPWPPYWGNFESIITEHPFIRWFSNTLLVVLVVTGIKLIIDSLAGYAFAKLDFPAKEPLFLLLIATLMVPFAATLMPLFLVVKNAGLLDTYWALILPPLANPVGIFLMRAFIETLPRDLDNAARLDGCSEFAIYRRIILPLTKPALVVLGIFYLLNLWNSFLWPLVVTRSSDMYVLTVGVASLKGLFNVDWGLIAAGSMLTLAPLIVLFVIFQRYFEAASLSGSLKG
jgi:ABC-type glycerol-3-phosphate transport system permease component